MFGIDSKLKKRKASQNVTFVTVELCAQFFGVLHELLEYALFKICQERGRTPKNSKGKQPAIPKSA